MSHFERSAKLDDTPDQKQAAPAPKVKKAAIYSIAGLIISAMLAWIGILGWGLFMLLKWLLN